MVSRVHGYIMNVYTKMTKIIGAVLIIAGVVGLYSAYETNAEINYLSQSHMFPPSVWEELITRFYTCLFIGIVLLCLGFCCFGWEKFSQKESDNGGVSGEME